VVELGDRLPGSGNCGQSLSITTVGEARRIEISSSEIDDTNSLTTHVNYLNGDAESIKKWEGKIAVDINTENGEELTQIKYQSVYKVNGQPNYVVNII
jgi:hypothetical protein